MIFLAWLRMAIVGSLLAAAVPTVAFSREEPKVAMEDILKEIDSMRRELRELKIQRDRDQRVIEELRHIVENAVPPLPGLVPEPATAKSPDGRTKEGLAGPDATACANPAEKAAEPAGPGLTKEAFPGAIRSGQTSPSSPRDIR
jgi:hypothetical protein